jgi:prepilin-type N-terminal cleavage/methylation domain-containing protein
MVGSSRTAQSGFSAIELLITLFVAAAFLATGYQLYYAIIDSGGKARTQAVASSIAYDRLRLYTAQATTNCTTKTFSPTIPSGSGLGSATITANITCPYGSTRTSQVNVTITYGSPAEKVRHVIYTTPTL